MSQKDSQSITALRGAMIQANFISSAKIKEMQILMSKVGHSVD